jgi:hypothetical protein
MNFKSFNDMRNVLIIIFLSVSIFCFSQERQEQSIDRIVEQIFDYISDETEAAPDFDLLYENLANFYENKINLNQTSKEELEQLMFLSDIQIENLLAYLYFNKEMKTIYELQLVEGMDIFTIEFLLPFVGVQSAEIQSNKWNFKQIWNKGKHELLVRSDGTLEKKKGYIEDAQNPNNQYLGSPFYELVRYSFKAQNKIQAGFSAEKDAGEQFWDKYNKGFDAYNAYIQLDKIWKFNRIVIGDFRATFGQGLVMNGAFSTGKSSYVLKVMPQSSGLVRKASADEYNFFRGIGAAAKFGNLTLTAFYSFRRLNADTTGGSFSTFKMDGLFRQMSDWNRRNSVEVQVVTANLNYRHRNFKIGTTFYSAFLNIPLIPSNEPYKKFAFSGKNQFAASVDYYFKVNKFTFFGETALSSEKAVATLNGVMIAPVSTLNLVAVQRYFSPKYDLFFAKAFGKSSRVSNENGVYLGAEILPVKRWKIAAYGDIFKFPYLTYGSANTTQGFDGLVQTDFILNRNAEMYFRAKYSNSEENYTDFNYPIVQIGELKKASLRYNFSYKIQKFSFRTLIESNFSQPPLSPTAKGFAMMQDIACNVNWHDLTISLHYVFFDAKEYNNRFYFYERDVPYSMSTPVLYGQGNRWLLNVKLDIINNLTLYVRFAQTIYADNRTALGTGLETINGSTKSDFRVMLKWNFRNKYRR